MNTQTLSVPEFLALYEADRAHSGWVDVRSEGEFAKASLPDFSNLPILTNSERHLVGLTYKKEGQTKAVRLGHELVDPHRSERVGAWSAAAARSRSGELIMICWRGGMRSQIAAEWTREAGVRVQTVEGGFKAIRGELLRSLEALPRFLVISGLTGSGKTDLLRAIDHPKIDLERLANHRGSSFGRKIGESQPPQATFENLLFLELRRECREERELPVLLEDESATIGSCFLPQELRLKMAPSACIWVESPMHERVERIFAEYVAEPLENGATPETVRDWMTASLQRITRKLGGLETAKLMKMIQEAFQTTEVSAHEGWIARLLELYYDPMYRYGFEKTIEGGREMVFRGTIQECKQWLKTRSV